MFCYVFFSVSVHIDFSFRHFHSAFWLSPIAYCILFNVLYDICSCCCCSAPLFHCHWQQHCSRVLHSAAVLVNIIGTGFCIFDKCSSLFSNCFYYTLHPLFLFGEICSSFFVLKDIYGIIDVCLCGLCALFRRELMFRSSLENLTQLFFFENRSRNCKKWYKIDNFMLFDRHFNSLWEQQYVLFMLILIVIGVH